eukprot:356762-Chlamydomonas_euryale.AAC.1
MARGKGLVALPAASSGIAGVLLEGGATAHIGGRSALANALREASMFIWDETPMTNKTVSRLSIGLYAIYMKSMPKRHGVPKFLLPERSWFWGVTFDKFCPSCQGPTVLAQLLPLLRGQICGPSWRFSSLEKGCA